MATHWRTAKPNGPPGIRFFMMPTPTSSPVRDDQLKIMIFTSRAVAERFTELEFMPQSEEDARRLRARGLASQPVIICMEAEKWAMFQRENAGQWVEYTTLETACAAMLRKREKYQHRVTDKPGEAPLSGT